MSQQGNGKIRTGRPALVFLAWLIIAVAAFLSDARWPVPLTKPSAPKAVAARASEKEKSGEAAAVARAADGVHAAERPSALEGAEKAGSEPVPAGPTALGLAGLIAAILAGASLFKLATIWFFALKKKPLAEGVMVGRLYSLVSIVAICVCAAYGFGKLEAFTSFFAMFGGMLLGFSLQAPVSGFAAWVLISMKRPFRPGDRVQLPSLNLTGDVVDVGIMYTVLDQVGGSIGSEEAVGRYILVPNAMLFSQVAINYTVAQDSAYFLDEVVVRITFDSDWDRAEKILLSAAAEITADIIAATGVKPYIRSDLYDYGVYLRLRYQTSVKDRAEIAYKISKNIFEEIQRTPQVDLAIPFVYSARAGKQGMAEKQEAAQDREFNNIKDVDMALVDSSCNVEKDVLEQLAQSIAANGLLQPVVLIPNPKGRFDVAAGQLRLEACKRLGWKKIPAVVRGPGANANK